ncbi:uncharacterized protein [Dermacentor albipictus]|uniref:uncharacterized protein n=1 Tax=Dermacentor albipictus TaxID=60249 RepID=UPI0031FE17B9
MDDTFQSIAEGEQPLGDSEVEIHVDEIEDPSDTDESHAASATTLRLGSACNAIATAFFTVLSAAVVTGLVFVFVLKPSQPPIAMTSGMKAAPGSGIVGPDEQGETWETLVARGATLEPEAWSPWPGPFASDYSEDNDSDVTSFNMSMIDEMEGDPENFILSDGIDAKNLDEVV